jgi:predicted transposase YbfD/YdcC
MNTREIIEERRYYINSIYDVNLFSKTVRNKWKIENKLHWHSTVINKKKKCIINAEDY